MSEPKLISPLLDGFLMGTPMSDHNGVQCCPAMKENSDHKYIVKIISVPASQVQLDALLLAGAYKDPADAMDYFKELSDAIAEEAQFLKDLAKLDGFLSFEGWQIVPMEKNLGYQVYLLGSYKRSLEKHMRRTMLTHLDAVNLGIDMCSALATARRAGRMYLDLKPSNIFLSDEKSYRIGDLGFVKMDEFRYTSLPGKYISQYTPTELHDPMATLNETADTYALGMVLYRIYNDGNLPKVPEDPKEAYPSPVNADYELAEIILKALSPTPEDRWKDPEEMGQALVSYMQRNSVNDTPITPQSTVISDPEDIVPADARTEPVTGEEAAADETAPTAEDAPDLEDIPLTEEVSAIVAHADDLISHEPPEGVVVPEPEELPDPFADFDPDGEEEEPEDEVPPEPAPEPEEPKPPKKGLLKHREKKEKPPRKPEAAKFPKLETKVSSSPVSMEEPPKKVQKARKPISKKTVGTLVTLLILGLLGAGAFFYYQQIYLQPVNNITIDGTQSELTVTVDTDANQDDITVVCIDTYGSAMSQPLVNGQAKFTELLPNSLYRIQLEVSSFHKLVGKTSDIFTTDAQARIVSFSAVTGAEDGSVQLNFTMDGPEPDQWVLVYNADGEPEGRETFSGHAVTLKGLAVGKTYRFRVEGPDGLVIDTGDLDLKFTASQLVTAQNLYISAKGTDTLVVHWDLPPVDVLGWTVRCYNDDGYDESVTVTGTEATFRDVDATKGYTVEVIAEGMTQPARATITANPITVTVFNADDSDPNTLKVNWEFEGNAPETGWLLMYSVDGSETENVITCETPSAEISPKIPGATYTFTIQAANGISIFENVKTFATAEAPAFDEYGLSAARVTAKLLPTPEAEKWDAGMITVNDYKTSFVTGAPISMILHGNQNFYLPDEDVSVLYVFRNGSGNVLTRMLITETLNWKSFWMDGDYHYGEMDLPLVPTRAGDYSLSIYFNGAFFASTDFTITAE